MQPKLDITGIYRLLWQLAGTWERLRNNWEFDISECFEIVGSSELTSGFRAILKHSGGRKFALQTSSTVSRACPRTSSEQRKIT
jgi:hypothetical protein